MPASHRDKEGAYILEPVGSSRARQRDWSLVQGTPLPEQQSFVAKPPVGEHSVPPMLAGIFYERELSTEAFEHSGSTRTVTTQRQQ